ncbi:MAG: porin [Candidatus Latescibacteria bacterium]|nr:porin [Candidatus Latescibacterota bacterium]MBT4137442.1 porin [Candidatus Latescibacterota bacterium]MBT5829653.1 porin [Candidatus Latescibacterota bacterium]
MFNARLKCLIAMFVPLLFFTPPPLEAEDKLITPYGSLRPEVIARFPESGDQVRRMDDGYSRVGIKGNAVLTETLTGFYKYERRVSANDGQDDGAVRSDNNELRQIYAGLKGDFGSFSIGRHYGLYYDYIDDEIDRHKSHYSDAIIFGDLFVSNSLLYQSPQIGLFNFGVLVELNDADAQGNTIDERVEVAATFRYQDFALHAGYVNAPTHDGLFGAAASYKFNAITIAGVYQKFQFANNQDQSLLSLAVDTDLTPRNHLRLAATSTQIDSNKNLEAVVILAGADHKFSDHFLAYIEFFNRTSEVTQPGDESALITGFRFDF